MKKQKTGILKQIARKKVLKEISEKEKRIGRKLEKREKIAIHKKVIKELRVRGAILGTVGILGIGGAIALNSRNNVPELPEGRIETELGEENSKSKRDKYLESLQEGIGTEDEISAEILDEIEQEIENLKTPEEVLEYTKQIYVDNYNEQNEEKIETSEVKLRKSSSDKVFYKDKAQNGDEILRFCSESEAKKRGIGIDGDQPIISVEVDGRLSESVAYYWGDYVPVYSENEEVQQYEENSLVDLAEVVQAGIDRATSMVQEETAIGVKEEYKERFVNAVAENRQNKQNQIAKTDTSKNIEKQSIDEERD